MGEKKLPDPEELGTEPSASRDAGQAEIPIDPDLPKVPAPGLDDQTGAEIEATTEIVAETEVWAHAEDSEADVAARDVAAADVVAADVATAKEGLRPWERAILAIFFTCVLGFATGASLAVLVVLGHLDIERDSVIGVIDYLRQIAQ